MAAPPNSPRRSFRSSAWWLAGVAFVAGLAVGAVIVGLLSEGSPDSRNTAAQQTTTATTTSAASSESTSSGGASGQVTVNQACLDAVTGAQEAYGAINDIAQAARDLNAGRLDEIVRSLQPLQAQLTDNVDACNITATLPSGMPGMEATAAGSLSAQPSLSAEPPVSSGQPTG